jgi:hypothetical protein
LKSKGTPILTKKKKKYCERFLSGLINREAEIIIIYRIHFLVLTRAVVNWSARK